MNEEMEKDKLEEALLNFNKAVMDSFRIMQAWIDAKYPIINTKERIEVMPDYNNRVSMVDYSAKVAALKGSAVTSTMTTGGCASLGPIQQSEVRLLLNSLKEQADRYNYIFGNLAGKVDSVLMSQQICDPSPAKEMPQPYSKLAVELRERVLQLEAINDTFEDLNRRIML